MAHRLGAAAVLVLVGFLAWRLRTPAPGLSAALGIILVAQLCLGIANVLLSLPLPVATAHNAVGAALLLTLVQVNYRSLRPTPTLRSG
jgi:cytochrome c oxidase assembly protein subunit 15